MRTDKEFIRELMDEEGTTSAELRNAIGVSHRAVNRWRIGDRGIPYPSKIAMMLAIRHPEVLAQVHTEIAELLEG